MNIKSRVELVDGPVKGWTGVVRDRKTFDGVPHAFVEWDHGEATTWLPVSRLRSLNGEPEFDLIDALEQAHKRRDEERCPTCGHESDPAVEKAERYIETAHAALAQILESDGFFLICVKKQEHPDNPDANLLLPSGLGAALNDAVVDVIEAQITYLAALQHQQMVVEKLKRKPNGQ